eukprot:CAMPEP_0194318686 /NCGR_PEP_ID=MMETSP0171-20130528/15263_1 /TAXON_ID=218684 /ORGANISM="Corethron pennatum, Strain L29A3" /LENGTH=35 /DNA_ID= /DNA_START= /DNA_END= /DNA_ORIENTATION=
METHVASPSSSSSRQQLMSVAAGGGLVWQRFEAPG